MDMSKDWSKLCPDVLQKIFEILIPNPIDSDRAKLVCSDWYSVWKTCLKRSPCPWRIIHLGDSSNPQNDKSYETRLVRLTYGSYCMASSSNWLLMADVSLDFHLLNLLTCETINLPLKNPPFGGEEIMNCGRFIRPGPNDGELKGFFECKNPAVLWIDEGTGDYVVALIFRQHQLFSLKKRDNSWRQLKFKGANSGFMDLAFKDSKLYVFTADYHIKILDFSFYPPEERNTYWNHPFDFVEQPWEYIWRRRIAIRESGEVMIILSLKEVKYEERLLFYVFKMNLESYKWERVESIGDNEILVFGHGVTVKAPVKDCGDGIKSNPIYFVDDDVWSDHQDHDVRVSNCGVFDIATSSITWPRKSCVYINETQWFVPGVAY